MALPDRKPGIRPRPTLGRRLDILARHAFPGTTTILLMLMTQAPFNIPGQGALLVSVALIAIWFWSVFRPVAMQPPVVFCIGLLLDLLGYQPLGVGVLTLLVVHGVAARWRRTLTRQGFAMLWAVFAVLGAAVAVLIWALTAALRFRLFPLGPAVFQIALNAALYPAVAIPLTLAHRSIADPEQA
jgi:rod shape-determining protein MreD